MKPAVVHALTSSPSTPLTDASSRPAAPLRNVPGGRPAQTDLERILSAPRVALGNWPTPIEAVRCQGRSFLIKRDDLSGFGRGGAKTRKIEHVLGLMQARGCDELITAIGNITNLGFDLLPALRRERMSWRIFVPDEPPLPSELRAAMFHPIADDLVFLGRSRLGSLLRIGGEWIRRRAAGRRPFLLLPGASHPAGVIGNARGFIEMARQLRAENQPLPARVFVTAATGTTIAGFLMAEQALRAEGFASVEIIGVQVYPGDIVARTRWLLRWTERQLALAHRVDPARIAISNAALGGGFGHTNPELDALCHRVHAETDLRLDPIFGGKTWAVMEQSASHRAPGDRPDMFWHCGHTPGWKTLVAAVRKSAPPRASSEAIPLPRKLAIIAIYVAAFYGALPAFLWSFGGRLDTALGLPAIATGAAFWPGLATLTLGVAIILSSTLALFRTGKGLPISHLPPTRLVQRGAYRWLRHPHYAGYNLAFVGCALLDASWGRAVGAGGLLLALWLLYATVFEEPRLERRFGAGYAAYRASTRALPFVPAESAFRSSVRALNRPLERLANRLVLFRTGPILWVTYGFFAALSATVMSCAVAIFLLGHGVSGPQALLSVTALAAAIALASRAAWFVVPGDKPDLSLWAMFRRVGFVSWGGYAGGLATGVAVGWTHGISALRMLDLVWLTGLWASAINRWGCFTYGCCIGRPAAWGVRWTEPDSWIHRLRPGGCEPRVPTQILSSLHAGAAGLVLLALSAGPSMPGALAAIGGLLYALPRFGVEHLRDEARFGRWQLTAGQVGCGVLFLLSLVLLYVSRGPLAPFWPAIASWPWALAAGGTASAIIFVAYGLHWRRVGRW